MEEENIMKRVLTLLIVVLVLVCTLALASCNVSGGQTTTTTTKQEQPVDPPVDDHEHNYSAVTTEPTCTEQGYTTYTCSHCGDSYVGDYVGALGVLIITLMRKVIIIVS